MEVLELKGRTNVQKGACVCGGGGGAGDGVNTIFAKRFYSKILFIISTVHLFFQQLFLMYLGYYCLLWLRDVSSEATCNGVKP